MNRLANPTTRYGLMPNLCFPDLFTVEEGLDKNFSGRRVRMLAETH